MPWALTKKVSVLISICLAVVVAGVVSVQTVHADAITGKSGDGLATQTERWLRLRAVAKCFNDTDVGKNSYNQVSNGEFLKTNNGSDSDVAIGYLNEDGKVSCGDPAFVSNTFTKIGYASNLAAFCSVQPMASRGDSDSKDSDNFSGCVDGEGDEFDMDSGAFDQGARQLSQFKSGYVAHASTPSSWSPSPAMMYYVYRESLVRFCGAQLIGKYDPADENNINADVRKLVVNDVDLSNGEIVRNVYSLSRDQTDKVDDIYVNDAMQNVSNITCSKMAQKTWDYDEDMSAYVINYNAANLDDIGDSGFDGNDGTGSGDVDPVCSAGALGWVLCPLSEAMVGAIGSIADFLEPFLIFDPLTTSEQGKAIKVIWGSLLGIANAGLIIAFLVIVFSQATSVGLSSYGIKKLLPRVIAAAILMNLSFYICAIAVDLSNILGVSVKSIIDAGIDQVAAAASNPDLRASAGAGEKFATITGGVLVAGIAVGTGAIFLLIPLLMSALMAILTAFLILAARQVLITLLIIVAPLAILAWILPNTESWFTKWRKLFTILLLMFPMIMAIFYGAILVSSVILASAGSGSARAADGFTIQILAFIVLFVPLFALPFVIKSVGGILERFGAIVNNKEKGLVDRSRKMASAAQKNSRFSNALEYRKQNRDFNRTVRRGKPSTFNTAMGKVGGSGYSAYTQRKSSALQDKEYEQMVSDAATGMQNFNSDRRIAIANTGIDTDTGHKVTGQERVAAARWVMQNGNFAQRKDLYASMDESKGEDSERLRQSVNSGFYSSNDKAIYGAAFGGELLSGKGGSETAMRSAIKSNMDLGKVTAEAMVHDADATKLMLDIVTKDGVSQETIDDVSRAAQEAMQNEGTRKKAIAGNFSKSITPLAQMGSGPGPTPPPSSPPPTSGGGSPPPATPPSGPTPSTPTQPSSTGDNGA